MADRHYNRQTIGSNQFCRPGKNLVLRTQNCDALWVSWQGIRDDGFDAWECTIFRNESNILSSQLIEEAIKITIKKWGLMPKDGMITYVKPKAIQSINPGYCFKVAGFKKIGESKVNKLILLQFKEATQ